MRCVLRFWFLIIICIVGVRHAWRIGAILPRSSLHFCFQVIIFLSISTSMDLALHTLVCRRAPRTRKCEYRGWEVIFSGVTGTGLPRSFLSSMFHYSHFSSGSVLVLSAIACCGFLHDVYDVNERVVLTEQLLQFWP